MEDICDEVEDMSPGTDTAIKNTHISKSAHQELKYGDFLEATGYMETSGKLTSVSGIYVLSSVLVLFQWSTGKFLMWRKKWKNFHKKCMNSPLKCLHEINHKSYKFMSFHLHPQSNAGSLNWHPVMSPF